MRDQNQEHGRIASKKENARETDRYFFNPVPYI